MKNFMIWLTTPNPKIKQQPPTPAISTTIIFSSKTLPYKKKKKINKVLNNNIVKFKTDSMYTSDILSPLYSNLFPHEVCAPAPRLIYQSTSPHLFHIVHQPHITRACLMAQHGTAQWSHSFCDVLLWCQRGFICPEEFEKSWIKKN